MRKRSLLLMAACLVALIPARTHAQVQIFGGYSYARPSLRFSETIGAACPVTGCTTVNATSHPNLNGWELSGAFNLHPWLGVVADFSGHYGSVHNASTHFNTYLFGPQVRLPGPVSPFAHVLIGGAHESIGSSNNPPVLILASSSGSFAAAVGAGIDVKVAPFISLRAIQLDYIVTRFRSSTQSLPRASVGLVLHF